MITTAMLAGCIPEGDVLLPYSNHAPRAVNDGWETSSPEAVGFNAAALEQVYKDLHVSDTWQIRSLLVFRNNKLVAESYFKDEADISTKRAIWSATKQFLGVLTGIAMEQGYLASVEDSLAMYLVEARTTHADKGSIRLRNILEMQTGIVWDNGGAGGQTSALLRQIPDNSLDYILSQPMEFTPGTRTRYTDGNSHLMGICIQRATGLPLDVWADTALFKKIGIRHLDWIRYPDGFNIGAFGILTTPRDMARLAHLVMNKGRWKGASVLSEDWISEMTRDRVDSYSPLYGFGYQWWTDRATGMNFMSGHGGQFAFIDAASQTIVVITSEPNTQDDFQISTDEGLEIVARILSTEIK